MTKIDNSLVWLDGFAPEQEIVHTYENRKSMNLPEDLEDQLDESYTVALHPVRKAHVTNQQFNEAFPHSNAKKARTTKTLITDVLSPAPYKISEGDRVLDKEDEYYAFATTLDENVKWFNKFEIAAREKNTRGPVQKSTLTLMLVSVISMFVLAVLTSALAVGVLAFIGMTLLSLVGFMKVGRKGKQALLGAVIVGSAVIGFFGGWVGIPSLVYGMLLLHTGFIYTFNKASAVSSEYVSMSQPPYLTADTAVGGEGYNISPLLYSLQPGTYNGNYVMLQSKKNDKLGLFSFPNQEKITVPALVVGNDYYVLIDNKYENRNHQGIGTRGLLTILPRPNLHIIYIGATAGANQKIQKHTEEGYVERVHTVADLAQAQQLLYTKLNSAKPQSWFTNARRTYIQ